MLVACSPGLPTKDLFLHLNLRLVPSTSSLSCTDTQAVDLQGVDLQLDLMRALRKRVHKVANDQLVAVGRGVAVAGLICRAR